MILRDFKGIVIPPPAYYSYEPLPATWEKILGKADVVDPLELTEEMDEFTRMPIYRNDEMSRDKRHAAHADEHEWREGATTKDLHGEEEEDLPNDEIDELYPSGINDEDLPPRHNKSQGDAPTLARSRDFKTSGNTIKRLPNASSNLVSRANLSSSAAVDRSSLVRNKPNTKPAHHQVVQRPISHHADVSHGKISDKPTDLGKDHYDERETNYRGSETAGDEDAFMMDELNNYNRGLNQNLSRIINKHPRKLLH